MTSKFQHWRSCQRSSMITYFVVRQSLVSRFLLWQPWTCITCAAVGGGGGIQLEELMFNCDGNGPLERYLGDLSTMSSASALTSFQDFVRLRFIWGDRSVHVVAVLKSGVCTSASQVSLLVRVCCAVLRNCSYPASHAQAHELHDSSTRGKSISPQGFWTEKRSWCSPAWSTP